VGDRPRGLGRRWKVLAAGAVVAGAAGILLSREARECATCPTGAAMKAAAPNPTNRLADATSPYLRQHAHNPVDWYPWGPEALARARRQDRPIFLSIGYATCHWCHVMAHESFEDPETARFLNDHFVAIKVDREERPDLDEIYMTAVQAMTGGGGWPLNVFLTPDLKPFYGGTYWPVEDRLGLPGFRRVLAAALDAYRNRRGEVARNAEAVTSLLEADRVPRGEATVEPDLALLGRAVEAWKDAFDETWGGFGGAPKFPPAAAIRVLLRHHRRTGDAQALHAATRTLDRMAQGGLYDHLGGGFHRYSVDREWLVPHFEKMLYDSALLTVAYLEAYHVTGRAEYARVARETLDWVLGDMAAPSGGFTTAVDADSDGREGAYYVWTPAQVRAALAEGDARLFMDYYDVSDLGNFEGASVLHAAKPAEVFAKAAGVPEASLGERLAGIRARMLEARRRRTPPAIDDKVLVDSTALAISALALGHRTLGEARYGLAAERAAAFILSEMRGPEGLLHAHRAGRSHTPAFQHDYAYLVEALVDLYEATFQPRWIAEAAGLADAMIERFWDPAAKAFDFAPRGGRDLVVRLKRVHDGATPSGANVAAHALGRLARLTEREGYARTAEAALRSGAPAAAGLPAAMAAYFIALDFHLGPVREVAVVGPKGRQDTEALLAAVRRPFLPRTVAAWTDPASAGAAEAGRTVPLVADRPLVDGRAAAYVCENFSCRAPIADPKALREALGR
jgi:hypothetical protein